MKAKELAENLIKNPDFNVEFRCYKKTQDESLSVQNLIDYIWMDDIYYLDKSVILAGEVCNEDYVYVVKLTTNDRNGANVNVYLFESLKDAHIKANNLFHAYLNSYEEDPSELTIAEDRKDYHFAYTECWNDDFDSMSIEVSVEKQQIHKKN